MEYKIKTNESNNFHCIKKFFLPFVLINKASNKLSTMTISRLAGKKVGDVVNLGQNKPVENYTNLFLEYKNSLTKLHSTYPNLYLHPSSLKVNAKTSIQQIEINNLHNKTGNYMVVFMGNGEMLEGRVRYLAKLANNFNCNIVAFNYRGKGLSTGTASKAADLISDGKAVVNNILQKGVYPNKITLYGKCLGAGIATRVAYDYHNLGIRLKVALGLPFSSLTSMVDGMYKLKSIPSKSVPNYKLKKLGISLKTPFLHSIIKKSNWEINVKNAYNNIPDNYKMFFQIRTRGHKANLNYFGDGVVHEKSTLSYSLEKDLLNEQQKIITQIDKLSNQLKKASSKKFKTPKNIKFIADCSSHINSLKKSLDAISNDLKSIDKNEIAEEPNPFNETYKDLKKKQHLIKAVEKIDLILPRIFSINEELESLKSLSQTNSQKLSKLETELVELTYFIYNTTPTKNSPTKIENIYEYAESMATALASKLVDNVRQITNNPKLTLIDCLNIEITEKGLLRLGHNKPLKDLHYIHGNTNAENVLNNFVNTPLPKQKSIGKTFST
jgi:hypothetical protein